MKTKVVWTSREWRLLADYFVAHRMNPQDHGFSRALDTAQRNALPEERWRTVVGIPKEVRQQLSREMELVSAPLKAPRRPPEPEKPSASTFSTEDLLVELARRIARLFEPQVVVDAAPTVDRGFHPAPKHDPTPAPSERKRKPKILVVGPKGEQQSRLQVKFPGLDLHFVTCEDHPSRVAVGQVDEVILWTKFMSHAQQDSVKALGNVTRYVNSMVEIEDRLSRMQS